jgi:glycosyltransferase involved in cell wall biosynthesis
MCAVTTETEKKTPLVSVGIPTYNRPEGLRQTLQCITGQTYKNLEIIVSDNCSPGYESDSVIREFINRDSRIRYFRQEKNIGPIKNFQFVLKEAAGEYFIWAADDDLWDYSFIESLVIPLSDNGKNITAFCSYSFIDMDGNLIGSTRIFNYSHQLLFFRIAKMCLYYDDGCIYGLHRTDILKRVKFPVWWGLNAKTPENSAYPPIFYLIASGGFIFIKTKPLWFNRLRINTQIHADHDALIVTEHGDILSEYFMFVLRKLNVLYECERSIWQGSRSGINVIMAFIPLTIRFVYDCINYMRKVVYHSLKNHIGYFYRKCFGGRTP